MCAMALETKDIKNAADMQRYVEGCLNDLMEGLSTKDETMKYLHDYTLRIIDITAGRVSQKPDTSESALPISRVVKSKFIWVRYRTWNGAMVTDVEKAESESEAVEKLKNRGMEEIEARQIYF
jgi:hypothetical protein